MKNRKSINRKIKLWFAISIQFLLFPLSITTPMVRAQEIVADTPAISTDDPASSQVEEPASVVEKTTQGPQEPTGPENTSYTYNPATDLWENQYYTWSPVTKKTSPKTEQTYSYNPSTGRWDDIEHVYAPEQGKYIPRAVSAPISPVASQDDSYQDGQTSAAPALKISSSSLLNDPNTNLGPGSLEVTTYNSSNNGYFDNFFNANISVSVTSNAQSGNASVLQNTIGGSALTGNALAMANIMNLAQSAWGVNGLLPQMYTENIQGDYFGDIFLDPGLLAVNNNSSNSNELIVNSTQDVSITNNIELVAQSGDALVQSNTRGGDAASGDATAILNLMNIINSSITTGQSFIGMLNIFGNLEGDVLMPDNLLDSLLASNIPTSQIEIAEGVDTSFLLENNSTHTVNNNIQASASSGDAVVGMNTDAGDAVSGDANTSITVFNLVGNHVVAERALLVFVNVQGTWVGFITNAPTGSNAALLGGGVSSTQNNNYDTTYNIDNSSSITNNVDLTASTGSASVLNNTTAGGATTGNANATANITNISNSTLSLANWFGILFINIFGNWNGSFGINTAFGNVITDPDTTTPPAANPNTNNSASSTTNSSSVPQDVRVFAVTVAPNSSGGTSITSATPVLEDDVPPPTVMAEETNDKKIAVLGDTSSTPPTSTGLNPLIWGSLLVGVIATILYRRRLAAVGE